MSEKFAQQTTGKWTKTWRRLNQEMICHICLFILFFMLPDVYEVRSKQQEHEQVPDTVLF